MRISDWSSDVCSSDLGVGDDLRFAAGCRMDQVVCMTSWLRNLHRRAACMGELDADETMIAGLRQAEVEGTRARCAGNEIYRRIDAVAVEHGAREDHPRQTVAGSLRTDVVHGLHE